MPKVSATLAAALLFACAAASPLPAATSCGEPSLEEMLASAPAPVSAPIELASLRPAISLKGSCTATVSCGVGSVTCTGTTPCTYQDRVCPGQQGSVTCGGITTSCQACACTNGAHRYTALSGCCCNDAGQSRGRLKEELCVNGNWINNGIVCEGLNCAGICPQ